MAVLELSCQLFMAIKTDRSSLRFTDQPFFCRAVGVMADKAFSAGKRIMGYLGGFQGFLQLLMTTVTQGGFFIGQQPFVLRDMGIVTLPALFPGRRFMHEFFGKPLPGVTLKAASRRENFRVIAEQQTGR